MEPGGTKPPYVSPYLVGDVTDQTHTPTVYGPPIYDLGPGYLVTGTTQSAATKTNKVVTILIDSLAYSGLFLIAALVCNAFDAEVAYTLATAGATIFVGRIVILAIKLNSTEHQNLDPLQNLIKKPRNKVPFLHLGLAVAVIGIGILFPYVGIAAGAAYGVYLALSVDDAASVRRQAQYKKLQGEESGQNTKRGGWLTNTLFAVGIVRQFTDVKVIPKIG
jgi:hypothetical protein